MEKRALSYHSHSILAELSPTLGCNMICHLSRSKYSLNIRMVKSKSYFCGRRRQVKAKPKEPFGMLKVVS